MNCGICKESICKSCTQFLDEGYFSFMKSVPANLKHTTYCMSCHNEHVSAQLEKYDALMEQAKQINVFEKSQAKVTRLIKRTEKPVQVVNCPDEAETLLRLAFLAAELNYNAIIDVQLTPKKVLDGTYQTTTWSGTGIPANVTSNKLIKDRSTWSNPN